MSDLRKVTDKFGRTYAVDMGTKNVSFLQTHQELKFLGIKNNTFMLELKDLSLADVDPYDPYLDDFTKERILLECTNNFWYFVREVARVPIANAKPVPIYLHRGTCAQYYLFLKHIDSTLNVPRRCYKTSNTLAGPYSWAYNFAVENGNFVMFNYDNSQVWKNLEMFKGMLESLPSYMRFSQSVVEEADPRKKKKGVFKKKVDNVKSIWNPVSKNRITTRGRAQNEDSALKYGRGDPIIMPYFDEAEWINLLTSILDASGTSYAEALNMALKTGGAACRLFTTTPGYKNIPSHRENYEKFIAIQPVWSESLYDATTEEINDYMLENGNGYTKILYIEYSAIQCRRDADWLNTMLVGMQGNMLKFRTEVLLQRLSADANGPFDPYDVDYVVQHKKDPIGEIIINGTYRLDIFKHQDIDTGYKLNPQIPYFVGLDCATGVGGDSSAVVGINPHNLQPAFEFKSAYISEPKLITFMVTLMRTIPNCIVFIETRSSGSAVIAGIRQDYPDVAGRLYKSEFDPKTMMIKEKTDTNVTEKELREAAEKKTYGISTATETRQQIQSTWVQYIHEYKSVVYSRGIINEIVTMKRTSTDKIEASAGSHDDFMMAWGFCLWGYHYGQKLDRWGFYKPAQHPLEKDPPPEPVKQKINIQALRDPGAYLANKSSLEVLQDMRKYQMMATPTINGYRRTIQFVSDNGVYQPPDNDGRNWLDYMDVPVGAKVSQNELFKQEEDFSMFY
jgi:hypothetical protein